MNNIYTCSLKIFIWLPFNSYVKNYNFNVLAINYDLALINAIDLLKLNNNALDTFISEIYDNETYNYNVYSIEEIDRWRKIEKEKIILEFEKYIKSNIIIKPFTIGEINITITK